jgi:hypothetical protein
VLADGAGRPYGANSARPITSKAESREASMNRTTNGSCVAIALVWGALAWGAAACGPVHADIFPPEPPNSKRVPVVETVDWGAFQDRVSRPYTVQAGDTLRSIAAAQCGDAARYKVVVEANPAVAAAPDRIRAGDTLWLPPPRAFAPVVPPVAGTDPNTSLEPWYDAFTLKWVGRRQMAIDERTAPAPPARSKSGSFLLVPHPDTAALLAALTSRPVPPEDPLLARALSVTFGVENRVHTDEGTVRIDVTTRLTGRDGASVTRTQTVRRLDAAGKDVTTVVPLEAVDLLGLRLRPRPAPTPTASPDEPPPPPTPLPPTPPNAPPGAAEAPADPPGRWPAWLGLAVAAVGGLVLGGFAVARRRRSPAA